MALCPQLAAAACVLPQRLGEPWSWAVLGPSCSWNLDAVMGPEQSGRKKTLGSGVGAGVLPRKCNLDQCWEREEQLGTTRYVGRATHFRMAHRADRC